MNTIIMNQDVHTPAFIKADASNKIDNSILRRVWDMVRIFLLNRLIKLTVTISNNYFSTI